MIKIIGVVGIRRIAILLFLVTVNTCLAAGIYLYAIPEGEKTDREIRNLRRQVGTVQSDIERMLLEFEQLDRQQDEFDALKASGFFDVQERSNAKDLFTAIQSDSKVISAVASIKSGYIREDAEAGKANHVLLVSPIDIQIKAFDDVDVYRYLDLLVQRFPGHLSIQNIEIKRIRDVNAPVLRAIATGANPELIEAKIFVLWHTMMSKSSVLADGGGR